ncbi:MAG TPA: hypothetical protein VGJ26_02230 [Pirellulales bacterium]
MRWNAEEPATAGNLWLLCAVFHPLWQDLPTLAEELKIARLRFDPILRSTAAATFPHASAGCRSAGAPGTARPTWTFLEDKDLVSMRLFTLLARATTTRLVDDLSQQISRRLYVPLREACAEAVARMTRSEARGYLWAKAQPAVTLEVTRVMAWHKGPTGGVESLVAQQVRERLVQQVLADLLKEKSARRGGRRVA